MKNIAALIAYMVIGSANAAVIDFEDIAVGDGMESVGGDRLSGGFSLDSSTDHTHLVNNVFSGNSGSTFLGIDNAVGSNTLTLSAIGGNTFSLVSLDLGEWNDGGEFGGLISLVGNQFGGGTVSTFFILDGMASIDGSNNFETFNVGWTDLQNVTFVASTGSGRRYWGMDNIVVSQVPLPGTLALLGCSLICLLRKTGVVLA